jgi:hypothetical protein
MGIYMCHDRAIGCRNAKVKYHNPGMNVEQRFRSLTKQNSSALQREERRNFLKEGDEMKEGNC